MVELAAGTPVTVRSGSADATRRLGEGLGRLAEPGDHPRQSAAFRLDVNTASAAELDVLPNIGESRAQQIIRERQQGAFTSPEDLALRIKGIGDKTVAQMRPYLLPMEKPVASPLTPARPADSLLANVPPAGARSTGAVSCSPPQAHASSAATAPCAMLRCATFGMGIPRRPLCCVPKQTPGRRSS